MLHKTEDNDPGWEIPMDRVYTALNDMYRSTSKFRKAGIGLSEFIQAVLRHSNVRDDFVYLNYETLDCVLSYFEARNLLNSDTPIVVGENGIFVESYPKGKKS